MCSTILSDNIITLMLIDKIPLIKMLGYIKYTMFLKEKDEMNKQKIKHYTEVNNENRS